MKTMKTFVNIWLAGEIAYNWAQYITALKWLVLYAILLAIMYFFARKVLKW